MRVYIALNNGDGTFKPIYRAVAEFGYVGGGWRVEQHPRFLADLPGDRRADEMLTALNRKGRSDGGVCMDR